MLEKNEQGQDIFEFLRAYDSNKYQRPSVTVDAVVLTTDQRALLIKRKNHPNINKWALPGGFLDIDESPYEGALRELREETSVKGVNLKQVGIYGETSRDPRTRIITVAFSTLTAAEKLQICADDDAGDAQLFNYSIINIGSVEIGEKKERFPEISLPCTGSGQKVKGIGQGFGLKLWNIDINISAKLAIIDGISVLMEGTVNPNDQMLAGDHALILFDSIMQRSVKKE